MNNINRKLCFYHEIVRVVVIKEVIYGNFIIMQKLEVMQKGNRLLIYLRESIELEDSMNIVLLIVVDSTRSNKAAM